MRVVHIPQGLNPYEKQGTERVPCWPMEHESVTVGIAVDSDWDAKLNVAVNGQDKWLQGKFVKQDHDLYYYSFDLGTFEGDDEVAYGVDENHRWNFEVTTIKKLQQAKAITLEDGAACIALDSLPTVYLRFIEGRLLLSGQKGKATGELIVNDKRYIYKDTQSDAQVTLTMEPLGMTVAAPDGQRVAENLSLAVKTFKDTVQEVIYTYHADCSAVYGLGERFCHVNHKGTKLDCLVFDKFTNQGKATYFPIPMYHTDNGHGLYLDTTCVSTYDFGGEKEGEFKVAVRANHLGELPDAYMFFGSTREIIASHTELTGKPTLPPKWTFGVWASANRWDRQQRIEEQINYFDQYDYPASVVVIEAWSDEATFYTWNDATYPVNDGSGFPELSDMTFPKEGRWPNPKGMIDELHGRDIKLVLWQIPILRELEDHQDCQQHLNDRQYAIDHDLCAKCSDGQPYQTPNPWFRHSVLPDFTKEETRKWWAGKRQYLLEMGVDGFKTDGGEFVFTDDVYFADGRTGREMKNGFAAAYLKHYHNFIGKERVLFSRAGFTESKAHPMHWAGDQMSTFSELKSQLRAGLSLGLSGAPYWSFDIGGFAGIMPTAELYMRATEMAAFTPVMQWHSDMVSGQFNDQVPSAGGINDRSPWNMQSFTGNDRIVEIATGYAKLHMRLMPYLYSEAQKSSEEGIPMMRHLVLDYPKDQKVHSMEDQYLLGGLLVAPIVEEGATQREVYLPEGKWLDLNTMEDVDGGRTVSADAAIGQIPVYLRHGEALILAGDDHRIYDVYLAGDEGQFAFHDEDGKYHLIKWCGGVLNTSTISDSITLNVTCETPFV